MRHERKYRVEGMGKAAVMAAVAAHPLSFRNAFPDRQVNSLYLDTPEMACYVDTLHGVKDRSKFRIRWYGQESGRVEQPFLEVKSKDGELGWKKVLPLEPLDLERGLHEQVRTQLRTVGRDPRTLGSLHGFEELPILGPTLLCRYQRAYLASQDGQYRLTIDWNLRFQAVEGRPRPGFPQSDPAVIVEVKYPLALDEEYDRVGQFLPFRIGKNSKYVTGILMVGLV